MCVNGIQLPVNIRPQKLVQPRMDISYPVVEVVGNPIAQQRMNNAIIRLVYQMIGEQGYYQNPMTQVSGYYEVKTNQKGILSLSIYNYAYSGGAHGLTIQKALTFEIKTGRVYQLKDLFKPKVDYVKRLSDMIKKQIKERDMVLLEEFNAIRPDQDFYIADKALVIYFQLYELVAYAFGFPYFPISVYEIQDIIDEQGPLGVMLY